MFIYSVIVNITVNRIIVRCLCLIWSCHFQPHKSWVTTDSQNVFVRAMWDNPLMHEGMGPPMYAQWNQGNVAKYDVRHSRNYLVCLNVIF